MQPQCIASDPSNPSHVYCGTFGNVDDGGQTWDSIGKDSISSSDVMSVSVSHLERGNNGFNTVYVGTEPSAAMATHQKMPGRLYSAAGDGYFESYDCGQSWKRSIKGLDDHDYLFRLAVDSVDPKTVSYLRLNAPIKHILLSAESVVYRRTSVERSIKWPP